MATDRQSVDTCVIVLTHDLRTLKTSCSRRVDNTQDPKTRAPHCMTFLMSCLTSGWTPEIMLRLLKRPNYSAPKVWHLVIGLAPPFLATPQIWGVSEIRVLGPLKWQFGGGSFRISPK